MHTLISHSTPTNKNYNLFYNSLFVSKAIFKLFKHKHCFKFSQNYLNVSVCFFLKKIKFMVKCLLKVPLVISYHEFMTQN